MTQEDVREIPQKKGENLSAGMKAKRTILEKEWGRGI